MESRTSRFARKFVRKSPVMAVAAIALVAALAGSASGAAGALLLGQDNTADGTTSLHNSGSGPALELSTSSDATPVLDVDGNTAKNQDLNADLVDGLDSTDLQRRVTGDCGTGGITAVEGDGNVACGPQLLFARVGRDGTLLAHSDGVVESRHGTTGSYTIVFDADAYNPSRCSLTVTPEVVSELHHATLDVVRGGDVGGTVIHQTVQIWGASGERADRWFDLVGICAPQK